MHYFFLFPCCTLHWVGKFRRMATSITSLLLLSSFAKPPPFFCTTASKPYFAPLGGELHYCSLCTRCSQQSLSFLNMRINLWFKFLYSIFMSLSVNCETRYTSWSGSWSKSTSLVNFHQFPKLKLELFSISCGDFKVKHAQHALWHFIDLTQFPFCKIQMFEVSWKAAAFKYSCIAIHGFRKGKKATKRQKGNQKVKRQQRGSESNL